MPLLNKKTFDNPKKMAFPHEILMPTFHLGPFSWSEYQRFGSRASECTTGLPFYPPTAFKLDYCWDKFDRVCNEMQCDKRWLRQQQANPEKITSSNPALFYFPETQRFDWMEMKVLWSAQWNVLWVVRIKTQPTVPEKHLQCADRWNKKSPMKMTEL